jgi:hydrogenase maturation protease
MSEIRRQKEGERGRSLLLVSPSPPLPLSEVVVIGYGNDLRGDDGAGRRVAAAVARWRQPGVRALEVHQLTPELAVELAAAEAAIFVDAYQAEADQTQVRVQPIEPDGAYQPRGHSGEPQALLALARLAYGRCPPAWWLTVPAHCFAYGAGLSPQTRRAAAAALRHIRAIVRKQEAV